MKKKTYEQPKMKVVELEQADIICASGQTAFSLEDDTIEQGNNSDWGTDLDW